MHCFKDNEGRTWAVEIHVAALKRVRANLNIHLLSLLDGDMGGFWALLDDPLGLVDVLYVLCMDQAGERKLSDEDFGRAMGGDALEQARLALAEEVADFFPGATRREAIKGVMTKAFRLRDLLAEDAAARVAIFDVEAEHRRLTAAAAAHPSLDGPSGSSGAAQESSASTPAPSVFAS